MQPGRKVKLNEQILKMQGEIKDAAEGLAVIESRCNVTQGSNFVNSRTNLESGGDNDMHAASSEGGLMSSSPTSV